MQWDAYLTSTLTEAEWTQSGYVPTFDEYMEVARESVALSPIVLCTLFFAGQELTDAAIYSHDYYNVMNLVNHCGRLLNDIQGMKVI